MVDWTPEKETEFGSVKALRKDLKLLPFLGHFFVDDSIVKAAGLSLPIFEF